jgi:hypothetical protein
MTPEHIPLSVKTDARRPLTELFARAFGLTKVNRLTSEHLRGHACVEFWVPLLLVDPLFGNARRTSEKTPGITSLVKLNGLYEHPITHKDTHSHELNNVACF